MTSCTTLAGVALFNCLAADPACLPRTADSRFIVHPDTLASVAHTESGLRALSVGINEPGARAPAFTSRAQAAAWVDANARRSLDVGIAQINTAAGHMRRRGLPASAALDPCVGLRVGAEVLRDCYRTAPAVEAQQRLREAASCYNTGTHTRGFGNGYVQRIQASAEIVVPAIRLRGEVAAATPAPVPATPTPPACAPAWDPWALAACTARPVPPTPAPVTLEATHEP